MNLQISELNDTQIELQNMNTEMHDKIFDMEKIHEKENANGLSLKLKLQCTTSLCEDYQSTIKILKDNLKTREKELMDLKNTSAIKDQQFEELQLQAAKLQCSLNDSLKNYTKSQSELDILKIGYENVMKKIDISIKKLQDIVCENRTISTDTTDRFTIFENIITQLKTNKECDENEKTTLRNTVEKCKNQVRSLHQDINLLNEKETINLEEKQTLKKKLKYTESSLNDLHKVIEDKSKQIVEMYGTISRLNQTVEDLSKLKNIVSDNKINILKLEDDVSLKIKVIEERTNKETQLNNIIKQLNSVNIELENKILEQDGIFKEVNDKLKLQEETFIKESNRKYNEYLDKENELHIKIQNHLEKISELENELSINVKMCNIKNSEIESLKQEQKELVETSNTVKTDLLKKNDIVSETVRKLEMQLKIITKEKESLEHHVCELLSQRNNLQEKKDNLCGEVQTLENDLELIAQKMKTMEKECKHKDLVISENAIELLRVKLELEAKKNEYEDAQENVKALTSNLNSYSLSIEKLESYNEGLHEKLDKLEMEVGVLNDLKITLENKNRDLEKNMEDVIKNLSNKNNELNAVVGQLVKEKQKTEDKIYNLNNAVDASNSELQQLLTDKSLLTSNHNEKISLLKEEISQLQVQVFNTNQREFEHINELKNLKNELDSVLIKYTESLQVHQEQKYDYDMQVKTLTENLHEIIQKYNKLDIVHNETLTKLNKTIDKLESTENEKNILEVKIVELKKNYDDRVELIKKQYTSDIEILNEDIVKVESALNKTKNDLVTQRGIQYRLESEITVFQKKISDLNEEKTQLMQQINLVENNKAELDSDYKLLQLKNENYIMENESTLKRLKIEMEDQIYKSNEEKGSLENEISTLRNKVTYLNDENEVNKMSLDETKHKYEIYINSLLEKITNYERDIETISNRQISLEKQIANEQDRCKKMGEMCENKIDTKEELIVESQNQMCKLQCAYDILQTGCDKLKDECQYLRHELEAVQKNLCFQEVQFKAKFELNNNETLELQSKLKEKTKLLEEIKKNMVEKENEIKTLNDMLQMKINSLQNDLGLSLECHNTFLLKIEGKSYQQVFQMAESFDSLKKIYEKFCDEYKNSKMEISKRKVEEEMILNQKNYLMQVFQEKCTEYVQLHDTFVVNKQTMTSQEVVIDNLKQELEYNLELIENLNQDKKELQYKLQNLLDGLQKLKNDKEFILEIHEKEKKENEKNILKVHNDALQFKNELLKRIDTAEGKIQNEKEERNKLEDFLQIEKNTKIVLETKLSSLMNENVKYNHLYTVLKNSMTKLDKLLNEKRVFNNITVEGIDDELLEELVQIFEQGIINVYKRHEEVSLAMSKLENYKKDVENQIEPLIKEKLLLNEEKNKLLHDFKIISHEKHLLMEERNRDKILYEQFHAECNASQNNALINYQQLQCFIDSMKCNYNEFIEEFKVYSEIVEKLCKERNSTETIIFKLQESLLNIQIRYECVNGTLTSKQHEEKEKFEIITEDIIKLFGRFSKIVCNLHVKFMHIFKEVTQNIQNGQCMNWKSLMDETSINDILVKIEDLKIRSHDILEQIEQSLKIIDVKSECSLPTHNVDSKKTGEDWKKKYDQLKQKLIISENVKTNFEKKVKQLREEIDKLSIDPKNTENIKADCENQYKVLVEEHVNLKEKYESVNMKYQKVLNEFEQLQQSKELYAKNENILKGEITNIQTIKEAYRRLMEDKSKCEYENAKLKHGIDDSKMKLQEFSKIKQMNEQLLMENSDLTTDLDTLKYKRNRDKEEFSGVKQHIKEKELEYETKLQDIRQEYENKLDKMRDKMVCFIVLFNFCSWCSSAFYFSA